MRVLYTTNLEIRNEKNYSRITPPSGRLPPSLLLRSDIVGPRRSSPRHARRRSLHHGRYSIYPQTPPTPTTKPPPQGPTHPPCSTQHPPTHPPTVLMLKIRIRSKISTLLKQSRDPGRKNLVSDHTASPSYASHFHFHFHSHSHSHSPSHSRSHYAPTPTPPTCPTTPALRTAQMHPHPHPHLLPPTSKTAQHRATLTHEDDTHADDRRHALVAQTSLRHRPAPGDERSIAYTRSPPLSTPNVPSTAHPPPPRPRVAPWQPCTGLGPPYSRPGIAPLWRARGVKVAYVGRSTSRAPGGGGGALA